MRDANHLVALAPRSSNPALLVPSRDLAASACPLCDLSVVVVGTGPGPPVGLLRSMSAEA